LSGSNSCGKIAVRTVRARYTRSDFDRLPEDFPAQLVRGALVKEPGPTSGHQSRVVSVLAALLPLVPQGRVKPGPFDVPIGEYDVFQPDVAVYAEPPPEDRRGESVPEVVFEVLSPTSRRRDAGYKRRRYLEAGVREVWLLDAEEGAVEVCTADGRSIFRGSEAARSTAIRGFLLVPAELFRRLDGR
jgi:Uma2 family endonuclease